MKRRTVLVSTIQAVLGAGAAHAQRRPPAQKLGYLHPRTIAADHPTLMTLRAAWRSMGYVDGESVLLRTVQDDLAKIPAVLAEYSSLGVGAVIVVGAAAVRAAARATRTMPLVALDLETDPVRAGYAASFARPGGNVTGLFLDQPAIAGKWIDLLREMVPDLERLAILWDASTGADQLEFARQAARVKGFDASILELGALRDFDEALRRLAGRPRTGIVQLTSPGFIAVADRFAAAARRYRLPVISFLKIYARVGVLMTYGPVQESFYPRAVHLADKILRGQPVGELPIEGPDHFELVINRATARDMGLTIPKSLILRADEVIG